MTRVEDIFSRETLSQIPLDLFYFPKLSTISRNHRAMACLKFSSVSLSYRKLLMSTTRSRGNPVSLSACLSGDEGLHMMAPQGMIEKG
jgi:hypothetical protein